MASRSAWTAGNGAGLTWATAINSSDLASMATAHAVLSTVADIANGTALDQFMDISFSLLIASSTIGAGATINFYIYALNQDGTTYGDGQLTAGSQSAATSAVPPCFAWTVPAVAATTTIVGDSCNSPIVLPPGSFRIAMQSLIGFSLTAGTQTVRYRTYNINLNN